MQVVVRDNNVDQALRALKKKMQREGIFREMKLRNYYEKPSEKRAREKAEAIRRARKLARKKAQREGGGGGPGALLLLPRSRVARAASTSAIKLEDFCHGRACPGHQRLASNEIVDARPKAGHDSFNQLGSQSAVLAARRSSGFRAAARLGDLGRPETLEKAVYRLEDPRSNRSLCPACGTTTRLFGSLAA